MRRFARLLVVFSILFSGLILAPFVAFSSERFGWQLLSVLYEPEADLSVNKSDSDDPVVVGDTLIYTVSVTNSGPDAAAGVTLTDTLPPGITFGSASPEQGTCDPTDPIVCYLGSVASGSAIDVTIVVTPTTDGTIANAASVSSEATDPYLGDNSVVENTLVDPMADLQLVKSASSDAVMVGQPLTYTLVVTNRGPSTAPGVTLTDTLPPGVTFGSATPGQGTGCNLSGGDVVCSLGTVASDNTVVVTIVVTPTADGVMTNVASVAGDPFDTYLGNNLDTIDTTVTTVPVCPHPLVSAGISGPTSGYRDTLYAFNSVITPSDATEPITYTWSPPPASGQGRASAAYQWAAAGTYTVTLEAENCDGQADASQAITISAATPAGDAYEVDDDCTQAQPILTDGSLQIHTFHTTGDEDWVSFYADSGTTYLIEAVTPADSTADVALELHDACGTIPALTQDFAFSPDIRLSFVAPQNGTFYLHQTNSSPDVAGPDVVYHLSVRSLSETAVPGALVLVAGRHHLGDSLQPNIHNVTNAVYNLFLAHGYTKDRILYLATNMDLDPDQDGVKDDVDLRLTRDNLELAITDWATDVGLGLGPDRAFTLFLMDHGGVDRFYLDGASQTVSPEEISGWLTTLETQRPGVRVNVIIEACHSGSFLDSLGGDGRVVIASTAIYAVAYATQDGAVFSDAFLAALDRGLSLFNSFEEAQWTAATTHPDQLPWLDDNGDGLPNLGDGQEAARRGFAYTGTFDPLQGVWPPYVVWASIGDVVDGEGVIEAQVKDDAQVRFVWAVVFKPSYKPPDPTAEEMPQEVLPTVTLLDPDANGIYSAIYEGFDEIGEYRVVIFAEDDDEFQARPKEVKVRIGWPVYLPLLTKSD